MRARLNIAPGECPKRGYPCRQVASSLPSGYQLRPLLPDIDSTSLKLTDARDQLRSRREP